MLLFISVMSPKDPCVKGSVPSMVLLGGDGNFQLGLLVDLLVTGA